MRKPPAEIEEAIEIANFGVCKAAPEIEWRTIRDQKEEFARLWSGLPDAAKASRLPALLEVGTDLISAVAGKLDLTVRAPEDDLETFWRIDTTHDGLHALFFPRFSIREMYARCASSYSILQKILAVNAEELWDPNWLDFPEERPPDSIRLDFSTDALVSQEGVLSFAGLAYPLNVLVDTKVDTRRIRLCVNCNRFFWAARIDATACSSCANLVRQKRFQKDNRDKINKQRRENYETRKRLENSKKRRTT